MTKLPVYLADKPSPPRNLRVTDITAETLVLSWDASESDGGSPLTAYKVEKRDSKKSAFVKVEDVSATTLTLKLTKLVEGSQYFLQVAAENEVGQSDWTTTKEPVGATSAFSKDI